MALGQKWWAFWRVPLGHAQESGVRHCYQVSPETHARLAEFSGAWPVLSGPRKVFYKHSDDLFNSRSQLEISGNQTGSQNLRMELVFDDASWH